MNKGQAHPSTTLYESLITEAFMDLIQTKKIESITISELCQKADVSRRTFYRHFNTKEDIVSCYMHKIMSELALVLEPMVKDNDPYSFVSTFFTFMLPYTKLIAHLQQNDLVSIMFSCYIQCLTPLSYPPTLSDVHASSLDCKLAYMLGGLWSLLTFWIMNDCKQTPQQLADIVSSEAFLN